MLRSTVQAYFSQAKTSAGNQDVALLSQHRVLHGKTSGMLKLFAGHCVPRVHFLGLLWNEKRQNEIDQNFWSDNETRINETGINETRKNGHYKSGLKTDRGFLPQAQREFKFVVDAEFFRSAILLLPTITITTFSFYSFCPKQGNGIDQRFNWNENRK